MGFIFWIRPISIEAQFQGLGDDALKNYNYKHLYAIIVGNNSGQ
jgi:hypothetical protein